MIELAIKDAPAPATTGDLWFDDLDQMLPYLSTLEGFWKIINARREYRAQNQTSRMRAYVVYGTWMFDEFGQVGRFGEFRRFDDSSKKYVYNEFNPSGPDFPKLLTKKQFEGLVPANVDWGWGFGGANGALPRPGVPCAHCGEVWTVKNTHTSWGIDSDKLFNAHESDFVGRRLSEVIEEIKSSSSAIYQFSGLRNDKHIDLSLADPDKSWSTRNRAGWVAFRGDTPLDDTRPIFDRDTYFIEDGDTLLFNVHELYHAQCFRETLASRTRDCFLEALVKAGLRVFGAIRVPNEYGSETYRGPWFIFDTDRGYIRLGWRKRVINVLSITETLTLEAADCDIPHLNSYEELTLVLKRKNHDN